MIYALIIVIFIAIDQISKLIVLNYLKGMPSIPIIQNVFHLTYVENRGAAFGILQNSQLIFIAVAVIATIVGMYVLLTKKIHYAGRIGIMLIIAGAIGNLIDRLRINYVVDFLDFRLMWNYVFNIADSFVVVGVILIFVYLLFLDDNKNIVNKKKY